MRVNRGVTGDAVVEGEERRCTTGGRQSLLIGPVRYEDE